MKILSTVSAVSISPLTVGYRNSLTKWKFLFATVTCDNPLYILPHSKTILMQAIHNDTLFLSTQYVMDYSLLVGLDQTKQELVVGIIGNLFIFINLLSFLPFVKIKIFVLKFWNKFNRKNHLTTKDGFVFLTFLLLLFIFKIIFEHLPGIRSWKQW